MRDSSLRHLYLGARLALVGAVLATIGPLAVLAQEPNPESPDFFETQIRPLLADRCWSCHGSAKQQGGLRLDSRQAMLDGGDRGPAVEPGEPENSLLVTAATHADGSLKMPPRGDRLPDQAIDFLSRWVTAGAPWPESREAETTSETPRTQQHWAFQPVVQPALPAVEKSDWISTPIDAFILAELERHKLPPSPEADRRVLIRRLTFDLTGLPPTPEEVEAFLADQSSNAYGDLVNRLLASPRYGERWGRHWLDVARYADTKGYVFQEERRYPFAYTYRDWVVRALNEDRPYDDFVRQQLAADRLAAPGDSSDLPALGFLTVGRRFLNNFQDITDDRIDVTTRGLLALTVACARCHDHKFDPIPAEDYYSLYGIFASSEEPEELPLLSTAEPADSPEYQAYLDAKQKLVAEFDKFQSELRDQFQEELKNKRQDYLGALEALEGSSSRDKIDNIAREKQIRPELLRWLAESKDRQSEGVVVAVEEVSRLVNRAERDKLRGLQRKVASLDSTHPGAPPRAMVMVDKEQPVDPHVFLRGNPGRPGPAVPRRFLKLLSGENRPSYDQGSGRLELAREITSPQNPLTARVMVNRVWMHHFGKGLVDTPSDFGLRSDPPSHPALLDWLASDFMAHGWSLKHLHRQILLSSTFRQQSLERAEAMQLDPENRLLWRQNRQRLQFEPLRDSLLAVAGNLDLTVGGRPVDLGGKGPANRRTLYAFIDRQNLDGLFRSFDFASPDASAPKRFVTTVPQQSLFLMNHPFPAQQASALVGTLPPLEPGDEAASTARIEGMYKLLFGRPPAPGEVELGRTFIARAEAERAAGDGNKSIEPWARYAQVLLSTNEFCYID